MDLIVSNWPRLLVICMMLATTSCSEPGHTQAGRQFAQNRSIFDALLKAVTDCNFQFNKRGEREMYATILSDPRRSAEFGSCSGDGSRTRAISALLRKVGAQSVVWWSSSRDTNIDFFFSDQYAQDTKTRTTVAIAYVIPAIPKTSDDDYGNAPGCTIKARSLTREPPHHWVWVYRQYITDNGNRKWCEDLRLP